MKFSTAFLASVAFGLSSAATATVSTIGQRPSKAPSKGAVTSHGCYNLNSTTWKTYNVESPSTGACTGECKDTLMLNVAAVNGEDCYCGDEYPPLMNVVDDKYCDFPCPNYPLESCGGVGTNGSLYYSVFNTGNKLVVPDEKPRTTSTAAPTKVTTTAAGGGGVVETIIETPTSTPTPTGDADSGKKGGTNVAGVAAGVVVGVVVIAAIVGGIFFYVRRKRNAEIEEEHRRNAAVNAFIGGSKPPSSSGVSMTDSRMDPTLAHRRMSDGSIADNQDYSRKILRVTNA